MKTRFSLFILLIIVINSCKNDEPVQENLGFFPLGEIKDYLYFKPGTWWVYKNSKTGEQDSISVVSSYLDTSYQESKKRKYSYEYFYSKLYSHLTGNIITYYLSVPITPLLTDWKYKYWVDKEVKFNGGTTKICFSFFYPFDSSFVGPMPENTKFIQLLDSTTIDGKAYKNNVEFKTDDDHTFSKDLFYSPTRIIYSKHFGLIFYQNTDNNETWKLVNSNIIQ